jgi:replicative DNA helicase
VDEFLEAAARKFVRGAVSTGLPALDKLLDGGLRAELYVIGAISSLGKTSLILQIADYISSSGTDVLFFSLEQSRHELTAKSLSRLSARLDGASGGFTARQMYGGEFPKSGKRKALFDRVIAAYREESARLFVMEGFTGAGLSEIREAVAAHKATRGAAPIVVVDYLQILSPAEPRATDKQNMDRAVVELKRMSRDFETAVIAVSSFNRENYRNTVSMESFKESGAVEYSSDVLLGMQLAGTGEKDFDVNKAKLAEPRQIELVMLKNRNGAPFGKVRLQYRAKYNIFT